MRYLVYLLVLANLAFFAWYQVNPVEKPRRVQPAPLPPGVDKLVLLSERPTAVADAAPEVPQESVAEVSTVVVEHAAEVVPEPEPVQAPESEPEPEPEPEPEAVSETESPAPAIPAPPAERICQTIGPLPDKNDAAGISAQLYQHGYRPDVRDDKVRKSVRYWVYLPGMPVLEARRIGRDLEQHGMKDYFIGKGGRISLGIFSSKSKARARQKRIEALGYTAKLDPRYRTRTVYWLDIEEQEQPLTSREFWQKIQGEHPNIRIQPVDCE